MRIATASLWFVALVVPFSLWSLYLRLTYSGIGSDAARWLYFTAFATTLAAAQFIDPNVTSLHRLYRDRLSRAFLFDPNQRDKSGGLAAYVPSLRLHEINTNLCPYPIVNTALNIQGSRFANLRRRNAGLFILTPEYTGSDLTGYIGTRRIETEEPRLDLGAAMAISGAAVSPNMGAATIKALRFTSALFNIRLGYWLRNPRAVGGGRLWLKRLIDIRSFLLIKEMFGRIKETSRMVYLTDGGHLENLGVYSLLKRRCKLIIAIDAEADPAMSFAALRNLERYAQIDLGAIVQLPWQAIRDQAWNIEKAFFRAAKNGDPIPRSSGPHCAVGEILYGPDETGILLYVKASLSGDESDTILDYKRRHRAFPHEATGDQFFSEEQLEVYRALGFHIMRGVLTGETPFAVMPDPKEPEDKARQRIRNEIRAALLGAAVAQRTADASPGREEGECGR